MKTRKTKIRRMIIKMKGFLAPLILVCYPASVVVMFLGVGMLTCDGKTGSQQTRSKSEKVQIEKTEINR